MIRLNSLPFLCLICAVAISPSHGRGQEVMLDLAAKNEANQVEVQRVGNEVQIVTLGEDPFFWIPFPALQADVPVWVLELEYFCTEGVGGPQLRLGRPARAEGYLTLPSIPPAEGWTTYTTQIEGLAKFASRRASPFMRLDLGRRSNVRLKVRRAVLRPQNEKEVEQQASAERIRTEKEMNANQLLAAWTKQWPAEINSVEIEGKTVVVRGRLPGHDDTSRNNTGANQRITARSIVDHDGTPKWLLDEPIEVSATGEFEFLASTNAFDGTPSSLVAWQVFRRDQVSSGDKFSNSGRFRSSDTAQSATRYGPVVLSAAATTLPALPSRTSKKGITGVRTEVTTEQLKLLGIQHGTINMLLGGLVQRDQRAGWIPFEALGRTWWASPSQVESTDRIVRTATQAGVQIAAVLLIRPTKSELVHPEFDAAGHYAMPNLTSRQSSELYIATLEFLAQRYSRQDAAYGRIDHWVVHNEVDYGWQWTNMGTQPVELFMDHYMRSLRIVDATTRRHNPHARTFISLTHRWNVPDNMPWKTYAPRQMLELLLSVSHLEGDFPWGVAYHPYPQSLWDSATWDDKRVNQTLDTELITIKNLTVLDRFMKQPRVLHDDKVRPVICSEQGFHAPAENPELLSHQCAALLYTWMQLEQCSSILAFDYHRPVDHPREGGLMLGLRGLASREHPQGIPKPAWDIYRQLDTEAQPRLIEEYQHYWTSPKTPK